jgi:hypothetical protein
MQHSDSRNARPGVNAVRGIIGHAPSVVQDTDRFLIVGGGAETPV